MNPIEMLLEAFKMDECYNCGALTPACLLSLDDNYAPACPECLTDVSVQDVTETIRSVAFVFGAGLLAATAPCCNEKRCFHGPADDDDCCRPPAADGSKDRGVWVCPKCSKTWTKGPSSRGLWETQEGAVKSVDSAPLNPGKQTTGHPSAKGAVIHLFNDIMARLPDDADPLDAAECIDRGHHLIDVLPEVPQ
jgi:hypothetical protein